MDKKRMVFRAGKWLVLLPLLLFLFSLGEEGEEGWSAVFSGWKESLGNGMMSGQSVVVDLLTGREPVFFETVEAGSRESALPFSLDNSLLFASEEDLQEFEEENRLYQEKLAREGAESGQEGMEGMEEEFQPAEEKSQFIDWDGFGDMESLLKGFYTVDSTTEAAPELFNTQTLLTTDCSIDSEGEGPQILLYHTHSQEAFADSVAGDDSTSIIGAGRILASLLEDYGYEVLHHEGKYDVETRDNAYTNSLPAIEQLLEENPSIQVVLDLHRDAAAADTRLVETVAGRQTAKVMFFNGLSRTKDKGEIAYLYNPYLQENLAFSFQMKALCDEYYPGFARSNYLRAYRYNMHLVPKTLLIELGAQTNTVEEIHNALEPLAHILDKVLSGEG